MVTKNRFNRQLKKCYDLYAELSGALQVLSIMATEALGVNVVADICEGAEIEFRESEYDVMSDCFSTILEEDVIKALKK